MRACGRSVNTVLRSSLPPLPIRLVYHTTTTTTAHVRTHTHTHNHLLLQKRSSALTRGTSGRLNERLKRRCSVGGGTAQAPICGCSEGGTAHARLPSPPAPALPGLRVSLGMPRRHIPSTRPAKPTDSVGSTGAAGAASGFVRSWRRSRYRVLPYELRSAAVRPATTSSGRPPACKPRILDGGAAVGGAVGGGAECGDAQARRSCGCFAVRARASRSP